MKHLCEMIVIDILPVMRKELALELINKHGFTKADVARLFDVSGTAISQYVNGIRGTSPILEKSPHHEEFMHEIEVSAELIATQKSDVLKELCRICEFLKRPGMISSLCGDGSVMCAECPKKLL